MYIEVEFGYGWRDRPTAYQGNPGDDEQSREASRALEFASNTVHQLAKQLGIRCKHCYFWPDGTLVKWVQVEERKDLNALLDALSSHGDMCICLHSEAERNGDYETHRGKKICEVFATDADSWVIRQPENPVQP